MLNSILVVLLFAGSFIYVNVFLPFTNKGTKFNQTAIINNTQSVETFGIISAATTPQLETFETFVSTLQSNVTEVETTTILFPSSNRIISTTTILTNNNSIITTQTPITISKTTRSNFTTATSTRVNSTAK